MFKKDSDKLTDQSLSGDRRRGDFKFLMCKNIH